MRYQNTQSAKCHGPRVLKGYELYGSEVIALENELLRVVVNVGRGATIIEMQHKGKDIDVLYKNPGGLRPLGTFKESSYEQHPLFDHHPGGWYECFPSGGGPVEQHGAKLGFHGEIFGLPFELNATHEDENSASATMTAFTVRTPWKLVKTLSLKKNDPTLYLEETATNLGEQDLDVLWGQHATFGAPFVDPHCYIDTPASSFFDERDNPRLRHRWPKAPDGLDMTKIRGPETHSTKMIFLTDFPREGMYRVVSPTFKLAFEMRWDAAKFPYVWMYENAGLLNSPWWGRAYILALEPFTGFPKALEEGHGVINIKAGKSETVRFQASLVDVK
jgi:galactose mutarotase-like enzyme